MNHDKSDVTGDDRRTYEGTLVIDLIPSWGKSLQGTWLKTADAKYVLSYRPIHRFRQFHRRRVRLTGEPYDPRGQHLMTQHLRVHEVELVDGQEPLDVPEGKLPTPERIKSAADLEAYRGETRPFRPIVTARGELTGLERDDSPFSVGTLTLEDGTEIRTEVRASQRGGDVTIGGHLSTRDHELLLRGFAVCEGDEPRCGVVNRWSDWSQSE
jgi:hypothetical protein